jgi:hypothetical protein
MQGTVSDDDDVIYLPPDWLVAKAITKLPHWKLETNKLGSVLATAMEEASHSPRVLPSPYSKKVVE